jgi:hypothetical protein
MPQYTPTQHKNKGKKKNVFIFYHWIFTCLVFFPSPYFSFLSQPGSSPGRGWPFVYTSNCHVTLLPGPSLHYELLIWLFFHNILPTSETYIGVVPESSKWLRLFLMEIWRKPGLVMNEDQSSKISYSTNSVFLIF